MNERVLKWGYPNKNTQKKTPSWNIKTAAYLWTTEVFVSRAKRLRMKTGSHIYSRAFIIYSLTYRCTNYTNTKKAADIQMHTSLELTPTQKLKNIHEGVLPPWLNWAVAELHHHQRCPQQREISFQRKFPIDNWSIQQTLHIPPSRFLSTACCRSNDNTGCARNCRLNATLLL